ncbi:MAG: glycosyltransferase family 39 protein [Methanoregula sp.]|nr:glycosyltransferase family 39 protein [Methanoregula sp.]
MAKKKTGRVKEKKPKISSDCDLDEGYSTPVKSLRDISIENIKAVLVNSRYAQSLLLLTVIGLFLRFYNLWFNSLWLDEASTYGFSVKSLPEIWQATAAGEFNPPLFYWVEHVMLMFGNNEIVLRFIPALLGVLTIPLVYLIGKEFIDRNVGIIAAAAFAVSPFLIYYSQEARAYSMMLFFVAAAMVFYLKALKTNDLTNWALFGVFSALAFWAHFYAFTIIAAMFLYAIVIKLPHIKTRIHDLKMLVLGAVVFIVLCFPLILVTIQLFATRTASAPTYGIQGLGIISETFRQVAGFNEYALFLLFALFVIGIIQAFLIDKNKGVFLVLLTVLTFIVSYVLSFKMPMQPRYLIFMSIIFFVGVAISYKVFYSLVNNRGVVYGFVVVLFIISAPTLATYYSGYSKEDWRGFSGLIQQKTNPGDQIIFVPGYISQSFDYFYYSNATDHTFEYGASSGKDLDAAYSRKGNSTQYYIVTPDIRAANPNGDAEAWLNEHTRSVGQYTGIYLLIAK